MNQERQKELDDLFAYLEDDLPPDARAAVEARLAHEPALREELAELRATAEDLAFLGDSRRAAVPEVNLLEGILDRVRLHQDLADTREDEALESLEQHLFQLGDMQREHVPQVDLLAGVLERVRAPITPAAEIADEDALIAALDDAYEAGGAGLLPSVIASPSAEQRKEEYITLISDLDLLGRQSVAQAPIIDIQAQVLERVRELTALKNVVPLRLEPKAPQEHRAPRGKSWWRIAAPLAAAAGLAIVFWPIFQDYLSSSDSDDKLAQVIAPKEPVTPPDETFGAVISPGTGPAETGDTTGGAAQANQDSQTARKMLTAEEILADKRNRLFGPESAKNRLELLAAMTQDQVRDMIATQDLDLDALLGAVKFLPREEAIAVLLEQLQSNPENPYLRYALANEMGSDPAARAQLAAWSNLDPNNALPFYMDARILLEQGDLEGALALLQQASDMDQAYPYSLLNARYHEQALLAAGMAPDAARLLAATTGGAQEYNDLSGLAQQMLQYGEYYEGLGDYDTAQALYNAAHNFGLQMDQGASFANERLAALETQQSALGSLQGLYEILGNEENVQVMLDSLQILTLGLNELYQVFDQQNQIFNSTDLSAILTIAGTILLSGDLNLF